MAFLPVVLCFWRKDRPGIEDKLIPFLRKHRDVVVGVGWDTPYSPDADSFTAADVAQLGHALKKEFGRNRWPALE